MHATRNGAEATLSLQTHQRSADLQANVLSVSAVGEQYVDLLPRTDSAPYLGDGSVIRRRTQAPTGRRADAGSGERATEHHPWGTDFTTFSTRPSRTQRRRDSTSVRCWTLSNKLVGDFNGVADRSKTLVDELRPLLDTRSLPNRCDPNLGFQPAGIHSNRV